MESTEWLFSPLFPGRIGICNIGFCGGRKTGLPGEKTLGIKMRTNNKLNPHMTPRLGIEPGPHWWRKLSPLRRHPYFPYDMNFLSHEFFSQLMLTLLMLEFIATLSVHTLCLRSYKNITKTTLVSLQLHIW